MTYHCNLLVSNGKLLWFISLSGAGNSYSKVKYDEQTVLKRGYKINSDK